MATGRPSSTGKIQGKATHGLWALEACESAMGDLAGLLQDAILSGDVSRIDRIAEALKLVKQRGYTPMPKATEKALLSVKTADVVREGKRSLSKLPIKIETPHGPLTKAERDDLIAQSQTEDALFYRGLDAIRDKHRIATEAASARRVADPVRYQVLKWKSHCEGRGEKMAVSKLRKLVKDHLIWTGVSKVNAEAMTEDRSIRRICKEVSFPIAPERPGPKPKRKI
jgi:hypothetical protein